MKLYLAWVWNKICTESTIGQPEDIGQIVFMSLSFVFLWWEYGYEQPAQKDVLEIKWDNLFVNLPA